MPSHIPVAQRRAAQKALRDSRTPTRSEGPSTREYFEGTDKNRSRYSKTPILYPSVGPTLSRNPVRFTKTRHLRLEPSASNDNRNNTQSNINSTYELDYDYVDFSTPTFGRAAASKSNKTTSPRGNKQERQWFNWRFNIIPIVIKHYLEYLGSKAARSPSTEDTDCSCATTASLLDVTCVYFSREFMHHYNGFLYLLTCMRHIPARTSDLQLQACSGAAHQEWFIPVRSLPPFSGCRSGSTGVY